MLQTHRPSWGNRGKPPHFSQGSQETSADLRKRCPSKAYGIARGHLPVSPRWDQAACWSRDFIFCISSSVPGGLWAPGILGTSQPPSVPMGRGAGSGSRLREAGEDRLVGALKSTLRSPTQTIMPVISGRGIQPLTVNSLWCPGLPYPLFNGVGLAYGPLGSRDAVGYAAVAFTQTP